MKLDLRNLTLTSTAPHHAPQFGAPFMGPNGSTSFKLRRRAVSDHLRQLLSQCNVAEGESIEEGPSDAASKQNSKGAAEQQAVPLSTPKLPTTLEEVEALSTALATKSSDLQARERDLGAVAETEAASWPVCPSCTFVNESSQVPECAICGCKNESLNGAGAPANSSAKKGKSDPKLGSQGMGKGYAPSFGGFGSQGKGKGFKGHSAMPFGKGKGGRGMGRGGGGPFGSGGSSGFSFGASPPPFDVFPPVGGLLPSPPFGEPDYVGGPPPPHFGHAGGFGSSSFGMPGPPHGSHAAKASAGHWTCMSCAYTHSDANPLESCTRCHSPNPPAPSYEWTHGLVQAAAHAQMQKAQQSAAAAAANSYHHHHGGGGGYGVPWSSNGGNVFGAPPVGGEDVHSMGASSGGGGTQKGLEDRAAAKVARQGPYLPPKVATSSLRDEVHRLLKQLTNDGIGADSASPSIEASSEGPATGGFGASSSTFPGSELGMASEMLIALGSGGGDGGSGNEDDDLYVGEYDSNEDYQDDHPSPPNSDDEPPDSDIDEY